MVRPLSRRAVLRGAGACLALPLLEAMLPRRATHAATAPLRFVGWFHPNGYSKELWIPSGDSLATLPPTLADLEPVKQKLLVVSGLDIGDGVVGSHDAGVRALLTACQNVTPGATDSVDQVIASKVGAETRFPSLQLGLELVDSYEPYVDGNSDGVIDSPTDQYNDTQDYCTTDDCRISFAKGSRLPNVYNPRLLFERLFAGVPTGGSTGGADLTAIKKRNALRKTVLDAVRDDVQRLFRRLGTSDKLRLDEYLTGIAQLERSLTKSEQPTSQGCAPGVMPKGIPFEVGARARMLCDVVVKAFQCDLVRSVTVMLGKGTSNMRFPVDGQMVQHHEASHFAGDDFKKKAKDTIDRMLVGQLAYLLEELERSQEGGGTLLDHSVVYASSDIADSNLHDSRNMPVILAGRAGGAFRTGRHVRADGKQTGDLFLAILRAFGIEQPKFGEFGTAPLGGLT